MSPEASPRDIQDFEDHTCPSAIGCGKGVRHDVHTPLYHSQYCVSAGGATYNCSHHGGFHIVDRLASMSAETERLAQLVLDVDLTRVDLSHC